MAYRFKNGFQDYVGGTVYSGDFDGDGLIDYAFSATNYQPSFNVFHGRIYMISGANLAAADAADGTVDQMINHEGAARPFFRIIEGDSGGYTRFGRIEHVGDITGNGIDDLVVSRGNNEAFLVDMSGYATADANNGLVDGIALISSFVGNGTRWRFTTTTAVSQFGDVYPEGLRIASISGPTGQMSHLAFGAWNESSETGAVYVVARSDFAAADAADGTVNGHMTLQNAVNQANSYKLIHSDAFARSGMRIANVGDVDGDGVDEILIGAHGANGGAQYSGVAYLLSLDSLAAADAADGTVNRRVHLDNIAGISGSYRFEGTFWNENFGYNVASAGDIDGDGRPDLMIASQYPFNGGSASGMVYLMAAQDIAAADAADGVTDGVVSAGNIAPRPNSWRMNDPTASSATGRFMSSAGDVDGDGRDDVLISAGGQSKLYLVSAQDFAALDAMGGPTDGFISLLNTSLAPNSYEFRGAPNASNSGPAGDRDGDGFDAFMIGTPNATGGAQSVFFFDGDELAAADIADGTNDNIITLNDTAVVVCFAAGTLIQTDRGARPVEGLRAGDGVVTLDRGVQPLRWAGSRVLTGADLAAHPQMRPIRIAAGALGPGLPERDLTVSPQHRVLLRSEIARRMFGSAEVLAAARHLLGVPGVEVLDPPEVAYFHLLFDHHEIVFANGAPAESLMVDAEAMRALSPEALAEIAAILPDCPPLGGRSPLPLARPNPRGRRLRAMTDRHLRNRKPLCA
jgi:hypothetical protein